MPKIVDPYEEYFMSLQDEPKGLSAELSGGAKCMVGGIPVQRPSYQKTKNGKKRSKKDLARAEARYERRLDRYKVVCGEKTKTKGGLDASKFKVGHNPNSQRAVLRSK